jgi:hypothetical protein
MSCSVKEVGKRVYGEENAARAQSEPSGVMMRCGTATGGGGEYKCAT